MKIETIEVTFVEENDFIVKKRESIDDFKIKDLYNLSFATKTKYLILQYKGQFKILN